MERDRDGRPAALTEIGALPLALVGLCILVWVGLIVWLAVG